MFRLASGTVEMHDIHQRVPGLESEETVVLDVYPVANICFFPITRKQAPSQKVIRVFLSAFRVIYC